MQFLQVDMQVLQPKMQKFQLSVQILQKPVQILQGPLNDTVVGAFPWTKDGARAGRDPHRAMRNQGFFDFQTGFVSQNLK